MSPCAVSKPANPTSADPQVAAGTKMRPSTKKPPMITTTSTQLSSSSVRAMRLPSSSTAMQARNVATPM